MKQRRTPVGRIIIVSVNVTPPNCAFFSRNTFKTVSSLSLSMLCRQVVLSAEGKLLRTYNHCQCQCHVAKWCFLQQKHFSDRVINCHCQCHAAKLCFLQQKIFLWTYGRITIVSVNFNLPKAVKFTLLTSPTCLDTCTLCTYWSPRNLLGDEQ